MVTLERLARNLLLFIRKKISLYVAQALRWRGRRSALIRHTKIT